MFQESAFSSKTAQPIAVIGMACRYPGAANVVALWENILARRQQFRDIPDCRLPASEYFDPDSAVDDKSYGRRAALLDGFEFDPRLYRIPRTTFETTDIVHWLALSTALEAFGNAGLRDENLSRDRSGVILGNTLTGEETRSNTLRLRWPFVRKVFRRAARVHGLSVESLQEFESTMEYLYKSVFSPVTEDTLAGGLANTIAGRICNYLDFHGGGYVVDGACSSSLLSIATAADYLNQNKLDIVIAGGVDVSLDPFEMVGFSKVTALSKDEMRVYDRRGHGFIPGEGCGMVVLQRLADARRDGNYVYAVLRGWGVSSDGRGGMTAPSAKGQSLALIRAYQNAGYSPQSLDFIEGHGTGTVVGDRVELEGIAGAFAEFGDVANHSVGITSFKSIVGHTKAAAGIGGFIKTVIALNRRIIPPTAGCKEPHNSFSDMAKALYPVLDGRICNPGDQLRAGVSAMGFGGINCHVTIESGDPPAPELAPSLAERLLLRSQQQSEVFPFSAADLSALVEVLQSMRLDATGISAGELIDLAARCAERLCQLPWRAVIVAGTVDELVEKLTLLEKRLQNDPPLSGQIWRGEQVWIGHDADCARFGFLFPGQGSQKMGMSRTLAMRFDWAQRFIDMADEEVAALRQDCCQSESLNNQPLSSLWLTVDERDPGHKSVPLAMATLTRTENAQPAICTASWLWFERLKAIGIKPVVVGGHSLGELTALAAAGFYDSKSLVRLAALRGIAMAPPAEQSGSMAALSCSAKIVEELLEHLESGYCVIANRNSPNQTVISGQQAAVSNMVELAGQQGISGTLLPVANAFHSRMVAPAAEMMRQREPIPVTATDEGCRIFSGIDGQEVSRDVDLRAYLSEQILAPVDFSRLLESMSRYCDAFIEVGPGRILSSLVQSHDASTVKPSISVEGSPGRDANFNAVVAEAFVRGAELNWTQLYAERLVRPFVPASGRKFYINPCERELAFLPINEESSGLNFANGLQPDNANQIARMARASISASALSASAPQRLLTDSGSVRSLLSALICELTGFIEESISEDARLIDDLNIDSIKAASLLGELLLQTQTQSRVDIGALANATLAEIVSQVEAAMSNRQTTSSAKKQVRWVRAFSLSKIPESLQADASDHTPFAEMLLIAPGGRTEFAEQLARQLKSSLFDDLPGLEYSREPSLLVVVLDGTKSGSSMEGIRQLVLFQRLCELFPKLWKSLRTIAIVQRQKDSVVCESPTAWSFAASISLERPELEVVVLGFDYQLSASFIMQQLAAEVHAKARYHAVEYDAAGNRFLRCITLTEPGTCSVRHLEWSPQDLLLVTGGGKGITAACALAFARETGVRLALIGRSSPPLPGEQSELASTFDQLNTAGIDYRYYAVDVTDYQALASVAATIRQELGPVTGVLHGAGNNIPRRVVDVSAEEAAKEIAPKVQGAENLLALFGAASLKLFAAFTSIIGVTGMRNNAWYAYSNEAVAHRLAAFSHAHPETAVVCYAFGVWDEVGMGVKLGSLQHLEQIGIGALPVLEGVRQFLRWLRLASPNPEVIVTASSSGLATWQHSPANSKHPLLSGRFLGSVQQEEPGVERISHVTLDTQLDLYLADHNYRGSLLLPTVMGLEAMAQNCLALIGDPELEVVRIETIRLDSPIVVNPRRPLAIEIRALAVERENLLDNRVINASIHTVKSGQDDAHFSASFIVGKRQARQAVDLAPPKAGLLALLPSCDLYGGVLFQGTLFQRISAIHELDRNHVLFRTEAHQQSTMMPEGFAESLRLPLVLGDPYYRDTLLQAAQLSLTPEICLPVRIGAIEFYASNVHEGCFLAEARVTGREGRQVFGEVSVFDDENNLIERITGYEVQVLERRADFPTPEELLMKPYASEPSLLQQELDQVARQLGFSAPIALLRRIPGLCSKKKSARRRMEEPLFEAVRYLAGIRYAVDTDSQQIHWLDSGKPVLCLLPYSAVKGSCEESETITLSLSHHDDWALCIGAKALQGCDLAVIINRSSEQWQAMFTAHLFELLQQLVQHGDSLNEAGTRLWSALEAAMKAFDSRDVTLGISCHQQNGTLFLALCGEKNVKILTLKSRVDDSTECMIAVTISEAGTTMQAELTDKPETDSMLKEIVPDGVPSAELATLPVVPLSQTWGDWLSDGGDTADFFCVKAELSEVSNQLVIRFRFPLSFKDGANPGGTLYFVRLFEWMGRLREMTLRPVFERLAQEFSGGHFAWVTNQSWAQILRPVRTGDIIEVSCRLLGRGGPDNAMVSVGFDWYQAGVKGALHLFANSQVQVTWAEVVGHGIVSPTSYPRYLDLFLDELSCDHDKLGLDGLAAYKHACNRAGSLLWQAVLAPHSGILLQQQYFSTSLNDANLVGNLYYTKYYELQGILRDCYFYKVVREAYCPNLNQGGLRCIYTDVKHLRDAMPFDTIDARMYLHAIYDKGIELRFEFFRLDANGYLEKLATGVHLAAWVQTLENDAESILVQLPDKLLKHLNHLLERDTSDITT
jgi:enediyne polyketide synthase